jgi:hypothetical protein
MEDTSAVTSNINSSAALFPEILIWISLFLVVLTSSVVAINILKANKRRKEVLRKFEDLAANGGLNNTAYLPSNSKPSDDIPTGAEFDEYDDSVQ